MKSSNIAKIILILMVLACLIFWSYVIAGILKSFNIKFFSVETNVGVAPRPKIEVTYYEEPYKVTVYTPHSDNGKWGYLTATGVKSEHLTTCAVDPKVIPLGSVIEVNKLKLKAVDTGSAVKGNVIDIFYDGTYEKATEWLSSFGTSHSVEIIY